ncbi:unnamed protein product [Adineta ricciae]|uniref:Putative auto-transporter adhesin head GIN domain-containing protein n=1 Tax=Adineta ricciae TaxID=249248 RepID=A0A815HL31_ADIRI|nr:unnamed protein product [Adineta ricciae]CAF1486341.1 unnamed protein product [Adineta ricciae]
MINGEIRRLNYPLDNDITSLESDGIISYVLTQLHGNVFKSTLQIETEQWVHDCCITVKSRNTLKITIKNGQYPKIIAYVGIRKSLSLIEMSGTERIRTTNSIDSQYLKLKMSGSSSGDIQLNVSSKLHIEMSGTAHLTLSGHVNGSGFIHLTGVNTFDGTRCSIEKVSLFVTGVGTAYVVGYAAVDIDVSSVGTVYYRGPIRKLHYTGVGSVKSMDNWSKYSFRSSANYKKQNHLTFAIFVIIQFIRSLFY